MPKWKIISGARPFHAFAERPDTAMGWARDFQRGDVQRTVNLCVTRDADAAADLPDECVRAIRTHGRNVFMALVDDEELPRIIDVTTGGLEREYGGWPEDTVDEDDDEDEDDEDLLDEVDWDDDESDDDEASAASSVT